MGNGNDRVVSKAPKEKVKEIIEKETTKKIIKKKMSISINIFIINNLL